MESDLIFRVREAERRAEKAEETAEAARQDARDVRAELNDLRDLFKLLLDSVDLFSTSVTEKMVGAQVVESSGLPSGCALIDGNSKRCPYA